MHKRATLKYTVKLLDKAYRQMDSTSQRQTQKEPAQPEPSKKQLNRQEYPRPLSSISMHMQHQLLQETLQKLAQSHMLWVQMQHTLLSLRPNR
jgi:hypothetical protein